jgi:DNA-binding protein H-NS
VTLFTRLFAAQADWLETMHSMGNEVIELEKEAAIRKIRRLMAFWRISPTELRGRVTATPRHATAVVAVARYRHPISGETWDGEGPQPTWLRNALLFEGYTVDQLRVRSPLADTSTSSGSHA